MKSNFKSFLINLSSNIGFLMISNLIAFISVPISLNYWGIEKYGILAVILTLLSYLNSSNLGLSSTAVFMISNTNNEETRYDIFRKTSILLIIISTFLLCFIFIFFDHYDLNILIGNISNELVDETRIAFQVMVIFFVLNISLENVSSVFYANNLFYVDKIFNILKVILIFQGLLITISLKENLIFIAYINGIIPIIVNLIKIFIVRKFVRNAIFFKNKNLVSFRILITSSLRYFVIGLAALVVWNTDNLVISHFISVSEVSIYSIIFKIYSILFGLIFMINGSLLPVISKEISNDNYDWLSKSYSNILPVSSFLGGLAWLGGILFMNLILDLWLKSINTHNYLLIFSLGGYAYVLSTINLNSSILNAFNNTKRMMFYSVLEAVFNLVFSIILLRFFGIGGVALGTFVAATLTGYQVLPKIIKNATQSRLYDNDFYVRRHLMYALIPFLILSLILHVFNMSRIIHFTLSLIILTSYFMVSYRLLNIEQKSFIKNIIINMKTKFNTNN